MRELDQIVGRLSALGRKSKLTVCHQVGPHGPPVGLVGSRPSAYTAKAASKAALETNSPIRPAISFEFGPRTFMMTVAASERPPKQMYTH